MNAPFERIHPADYPPVEHRPVLVRHSLRCRVKAVNIGIQCKYGVRIVQRSEELATYFFNAGRIKLKIVPRLSIGKHIPAKRVRAISIKSLERIHGIAQTLAHLLSLLVKHQSVGYDPLEGRSSAYHRMDCMQGIEPSSCLIHALCDEIRSTTEITCILASESCLRIRHRAGIKPHVYQIRLSCHLLPAWADKENIIHIRTMKIYPVIIVLTHVIRREFLVFQRI